MELAPLLDDIEALSRLIGQAHQTAQDKNFWNKAHLDLLKKGVGDSSYSAVVEKLFLIADEVFEAGHEVRSPQSSRVKILEECADIIIRAFDLIGALQTTPVEGADILFQKMITNLERPSKHGKRF